MWAVFVFAEGVPSRVLCPGPAGPWVSFARGPGPRRAAAHPGLSWCGVGVVWMRVAAVDVWWEVVSLGPGDRRDFGAWGVGLGRRTWDGRWTVPLLRSTSARIPTSSLGRVYVRVR